MSPSITTKPPFIECGRRHRHTKLEQVAECDLRLALREQWKREILAKGGRQHPTLPLSITMPE